VRFDPPLEGRTESVASDKPLASSVAGDVTEQVADRSDGRGPAAFCYAVVPKRLVCEGFGQLGQRQREASSASASASSASAADNGQHNTASTNHCGQAK
jgi:hypothetical protein